MNLLKMLNKLVQRGCKVRLAGNRKFSKNHQNLGIHEQTKLETSSQSIHVAQQFPLPLKKYKKEWLYYKYFTLKSN
jgi:hypothetical protein